MLSSFRSLAALACCRVLVVLSCLSIWSGLNTTRGMQLAEVEIYCTAKLSSAGCTNDIATSSSSAPTSGANNFSVTCSNVQGLKCGLLFTGISGPTNLPFSGGTLCVNPPNKRGPMLHSGGTSTVSCDGSYATLINDGQTIPFGLDAGAGNTAWYQYWYRDPGNGAGDLGTALSNAVEVDFLQAGVGSLFPGAKYAAGDTPTSVAIEDLNLDGLPDLAVANAGSDDVSVLLGQGDGTFGVAQSFAAGDGPQSVAIEDLNQDGLPDLAVANENSGDVSVLLNQL